MKSVFSGLWAWVLFMVASLGLVYWASLPQDQKTAKRSTHEIDKKTIAIVHLSLNGNSTLAEKTQHGEPRWWIKTNTGSADERQGESSNSAPSKFLASERFNEYLDLVSKLPALRDIGEVDETKRGDFGFSNETNWLKLKNDKRELLAELIIGKQSYGARSYYLMRKSDRRVFLVSSDLIEDFSKPEARFFERKITSVSLQDTKRVKFSMSGKLKSYVRLADGGGGETQWADESKPGAPVPAVAIWLEKFLDLKAARYADDSLEERLRTLPATMELVLGGDKGDFEKLQIKSMGSDDRVEFYLISGYLSWPVKVATARVENLMKDLPPLL